MGAGRPAALGAVAAGIAADWLLGEPPASWHPVAGFGRAMEGLEARWYADSRGRGIAYAAAGAGAAALAGSLLDRARPAHPGRAAGAGPPAWPWPPTSRWPGRALAEAAGAVDAALAAGDLDAARARLPALVGRDPTGLDEAEIVRAVVESVAENTVDAVVAAALWAACGGAPACWPTGRSTPWTPWSVTARPATPGSAGPRRGRTTWPAGYPPA